MTDIFDPVILATVLQTVVLTLTLVIFIMSFRSQINANKESAYQKVLDDYSDTMKMLVERPELNRIQVELVRMGVIKDDAIQSAEDFALRNYVLLIYSLFERIHLLYRKKWIDQDTWDQWDAFLTTIAKHPLFGSVHRSSEGMFDKPFQDYVTNILGQTK